MRPFACAFAVLLALLLPGRSEGSRAGASPLAGIHAPGTSHPTRRIASPSVESAQHSHDARWQASMAMLGQVEEVDRAARVHPGVAFLMSAILPGSGQLAEGRNRAFAYLGVEAVSWIAHFSWLDAGNKKEGEYESYARQHWQFTQWDSLAAESNPSCEALPPNVQYDDARETILGYLEEENYQHYYEDIGKLEAYRSGWDDFRCDDPETISPNRTDYREMREESNDYLDKASNAMTVIFLNHIVSAIDAYRTAKGVRMRVPGGAEVKFRVAGSPSHPTFGLRITRPW